MDRFHEGYDGELLFFYYIEVPCLNDKGLQFQPTLGNDLGLLLREGLESLALLCSLFNSQLPFNLGILGNVLIFGLHFVLT